MLITVIGSPVTAAGNSWRWQLRDSKGQWIEMGSEVRWLARGRWLHGIVEGSPSPGMADVREYETGRNQLIAASRLSVVEEAESLLRRIDAEHSEKGKVDWKSLDLTTEKTQADVLSPLPKPPAEVVPIQMWAREVERASLELAYGGTVPESMLTDEALDARVRYMGAPKPKEILRRNGVTVLTWDKKLSKPIGDTSRRRSVKVNEVVDLLEHAEWLQAADPTHDGITTISIRQSPPNEFWDAYSTPNGNWMIMNVDALTMYRPQGTRPLPMPSYREYPNSIHTMTHEYGHMRDDRTDEQRAGDDSAIVGIPGMSDYGKTNGYEAYAEAYAEWMLTQGTTDNDVVRYFGQKYGWPVPKEASKWRL